MATTIRQKFASVALVAATSTAGLAGTATAAAAETATPVTTATASSEASPQTIGWYFVEWYWGSAGWDRCDLEGRNGMIAKQWDLFECRWDSKVGAVALWAMDF